MNPGWFCDQRPEGCRGAKLQKDGWSRAAHERGRRGLLRAPWDWPRSVGVDVADELHAGATRDYRRARAEDIATLYDSAAATRAVRRSWGQSVVLELRPGPGSRRICAGIHDPSSSCDETPRAAHAVDQRDGLAARRRGATCSSAHRREEPAATAGWPCGDPRSGRARPCVPGAGTRRPGERRVVHAGVDDVSATAGTQPFYNLLCEDVRYFSENLSPGTTSTSGRRRTSRQVRRTTGAFDACAKHRYWCGDRTWSAAAGGGSDLDAVPPVTGRFVWRGSTSTRPPELRSATSRGGTGSGSRRTSRRRRRLDSAQKMNLT